MRRRALNRSELKKVIRGTIVTMPTAFDDNYKLDLDTMAEITKWYISEGLGSDTSPLKVGAAMGEGPDLADDELAPLLKCVIDAADGKANVICAVKPKNTMHTIKDAKMAQDLGAIGLQIDLPFFHHANQDDNVRHFTDISDAIEIGIMIYNTHWFCHSPVEEYLTADSMLRLADAEHVTAIKWGVPDGEDYDDMTKFSDIFNVIDNTGQTERCMRNGGAGYISSLIAVSPAYEQAQWKLYEAGKYDEANAKKAEVSGVLAEWQAATGRKSGGYRQMKGMLEAMGRSMGPTRPPTLPLDAAEVAQAGEAARKLGWM
jgi:dihydrodipicolinate synthase/N-acetylneuraminate lyase